MAAPQQRVLVFTDVVDSTRMTERLGDAGAARLWAEHDRRARELLAAHHGREIDRSDGFLLVFERASDAAHFASAYHDALAELGLAARVGMHAGSVTLRENAADDVARGAKPVEVDGLAKPLAARVMSLARGGQTLVTAALRELASLQPHGHYRLKGIDEPVEVFEIGNAPGLPPADADKAYRVVRVDDVWRPVRAIRNNLPAERDAFVGRGAELRALADRLDRGARLVTVLGPGGTGKTRLVRRYGLAFLGDWPGGVYFCDLSETRSLDGIHFAVAAALEVPLGRDDPGVQLGNAIAGRGRCLVILDNFEQVVEHADVSVGRWLDAAPQAAFVATSRERLHVAGEEAFPVEPLAIGADAIELFATRARAQRPDFALGDANRAAVAEVVRLLDGLPLAIELAAARVRVLSPTQLVERLRDRFSLLAGARGVAARQATLRAAIDWSWDLLTPWEQGAFAQCATFDGGFTLEAAEAVLDVSRWPDAPPVMDVVQALSDKSLLRTWAPAGGSRYDIEETYFGMYLSIREYAAEKLTAGGGAPRAEIRHGRYFAGFGKDDAIEALSRTGGTRLRRALALEVDNLVAACRRAVARRDGETAVGAYRAAWEVLELTGPSALGTSLGAEVLAMPDVDASLRAAALAARSTALRRAGRTEEAADGYAEALAHFRAVRERAREAGVLTTFGNLHRDLGRHDDARALLAAALVIAREIGNRRLEGSLLGNIAIVHAEQGRYDEARPLLEQALAIHREVGNLRIEGIDTSNLGNVCRESGLYGDARTHYERALALDREVGNRRDEGIVIANLGMLESDEGHTAEARERYEASLQIAREVGDRRVEGFLLGSLANVLRDLGSHDEAMRQCQAALAIHRAVSHRRAEGSTLGTLGELLAHQGRFAEAREALRKGDTLLRDVGDKYGRASLLCDWSLAEVAAGDPAAARAALDEAAAIVDFDHGGADTEAGRRIAALRATLP